MTTDAVGGVFTYSVQLAASLASLGVGVLLASMGRGLSPEQYNQAERAGAALAVSDYRLEWMDDPWSDVERAGEWLLGLEREFRPDVVHVNGYAHAALPWSAPALAVAHSCVCSWWRAVLGERAPARYDRYRAAVARGLGQARATVAPTAAMLRCLHREYGWGHGHVIHNGIDFSGDELDGIELGGIELGGIELGGMAWGGTASRDSELGSRELGGGELQGRELQGRRLEPRPHEEEFILSAGRVWDRAKNIPLLDRAAAELDWPVFVAGDGAGPDGREAPPLQHALPLGFLARAELAGWMGRAAIFALPARYEPFGLSILEAAAARCALVLGDIPSLRELWAGAAVFVDPDDAAGLARVLGELARDRERRHRLGERARQRAERYGAAPMAARYHELYRELMRSRCASSAPQDTEPEMRPDSRPEPTLNGTLMQ